MIKHKRKSYKPMVSILLAKCLFICIYKEPKAKEASQEQPPEKIVLFEGKKNQKPRGVPIRPEPLVLYSCSV
jgi:hypothetical protein